MPYNLHVIRPSGDHQQRVVDKKLMYKNESELVGGLIQYVPHGIRYEGKVREAVVNEEGVLLGLPLNRLATKMWLDRLGEGPFSYEPQLYGTMFFYVPMK